MISLLGLFIYQNESGVSPSPPCKNDKKEHQKAATPLCYLGKESLLLIKG